MSVVAFVGFGELAAGLAEGLARSGRHELRAYLRHPARSGSAQERRLSSREVTPYASLAEAIGEATLVLAAVPAAAQQEVAECCSPLLQAGAMYVDLVSATPEAKQVAAASIASGRGAYVDAAVLGTVVTSGFEVPILASGPGARRFQALVEPDGLKVEVIDAAPGDAALVKLIRGIYLKGRDALIVEMMLTARRCGVEQVVVESLDVPGEGVSFASLMQRVLRSLAVHAERRAAELAASSEIVAGAGIDPALTLAGAGTLQSLAALGLPELFDGERPEDANAVLEAIDACSAARAG